MGPMVILTAICSTFLLSTVVGYKVGQHCDPAEYANVVGHEYLPFAKGIENAITSIFGKRHLSKRETRCRHDSDCSMHNTFVCAWWNQKYERCDQGFHKGRLHLECRNHTCYCMINQPSTPAHTAVVHRTCSLQSDCDHMKNQCSKPNTHHCVDGHCCCKENGNICFKINSTTTNIPKHTTTSPVTKEWISVTKTAKPPTTTETNEQTSTPLPLTTQQGSLSCYQCGDVTSRSPCSISYVYQGQSTPCQNGQFCQTDIYTDSNGQKEIYKRCVSEQTCQHEWLEQSSDKEYCVKYGQVQQTDSFVCSFCCVGSDCNAGIVPSNSTLYGGTRQLK